MYPGSQSPRQFEILGFGQYGFCSMVLVHTQVQHWVLVLLTMQAVAGRCSHRRAVHVGRNPRAPGFGCRPCRKTGRFMHTVSSQSTAAELTTNKVWPQNGDGLSFVSVMCGLPAVCCHNRAIPVSPLCQAHTKTCSHCGLLGTSNYQLYFGKHLPPGKSAKCLNYVTAANVMYTGWSDFGLGMLLSSHS